MNEVVRPLAVLAMWTACGSDVRGVGDTRDDDMIVDTLVASDGAEDETLEEDIGVADVAAVCKPTAPDEICDNGIDDDCDGLTDKALDDPDGDGFTRCEDCCEGAEACGLEPGGALAGAGGCDDDDLPIDGDAWALLYAMGLCGGSGETLLAARLLSSDGGPLPEVNIRGWGVLANFGVNLPREGARVAALSTGVARDVDDVDYESPAGLDWGYVTGQPAIGFPIETERCPGVSSGEPHDGIALEVQLRVPPDAHAFAFDANVFYFEWPNYVCTQFNDVFLTLVSPAPRGSILGNVALDANGQHLSVSSANVRVCDCGDGCVQQGVFFDCPLGPDALVGTGFDRDSVGNLSLHRSAATGWLTTVAPVAPGSVIVVRFVIYDSGDGLLDATVLIDNWRWLRKEGATSCATPAPDP